MYHRMPSTPRAGPSGLSAAAPRYYDYTEGFESGQPRATTPVLPLAPIPTRVSNYSRPLVLQESDDSLGAAFGEGESVFSKHESQNPNETDVAKMPRGSVTPRAENSQAAPYRAPSRCHTGSIRSESRSITFDTPDATRKFTRGSDIDLLPSQAGRDSMDTFNPSLDVESKDAPTYRYTDYRMTATPKTKKSSPERQVQVQGGGAPSVRSEQGVILRDDTQNETIQDGLERNADADKILEQSRDSSQFNATERRSFSEPVQGQLTDSIQPFDGQYTSATMGRNNSHHSKTGEVKDGTTTASLHDAENGIGGDDGRPLIATAVSSSRGGYVGGNDIVPVTIEQAPEAAPRQRYNHKRSRAVPRISTSSLPREDNEGFPHIPPSCSTTTIVSPKPISPARQLKLKNSIPQLMKALPSLPGDPDYGLLPAPSIQSTSSNEGKFAEVLSPFKFSQSSTPWLFGNKRSEIATEDENVY
ncbi:Vacuolar fusion protein mon1 [Hypoxylon texense]